MSTLLPYPRFKAVDSLGVPLSGGKVYTYIAGTSTAKASYSDAYGTPNPNPVVLDSNGEATIFLIGLYKIVLETSLGAAVWTMDYLSGYGFEDIGCYYPDWNELDQGKPSTGASLKDLIDARGGDSATIILTHTHFSDVETLYVLSTSETVPANINLKIEKGAKISISGGVTLTINGNIDAGDYEIFTGSGTVTGNPLNAIMLSAWFNAGVTNATAPVGVLKSIAPSSAQGDLFYHNGTIIVRLAAGTSGQILKTGGTSGAPAWITPPSIRDRARNLIITNNASHADHQIDVDADEVILQNTDGMSMRVASVNLTIDTAAAGANGLDTGTVAISTWYFIWVISNGTTTAGLFSTSSTVPTMPTGYTFKGLVGAKRTNGSSQFVATYQVGDTVMFDAPLAVVTGGGSQGALSLNLSAAIPDDIVKCVLGKTGANTGALNFFADYDTYATSQGPDNSVVPLQISFAGANDYYTWSLLIKTPHTIWYSVSANDVDMWITGYTLR